MPADWYATLSWSDAVFLCFGLGLVLGLVTNIVRSAHK